MGASRKESEDPFNLILLVQVLKSFDSL
uniref:Uncharacterized protein n=1 Tax=Vitis vinifera TaxID=29760 RepID=F6I1F7_VITVI